jgi:8-oxo-dGTP diphosphatase
MCLCFLTRVTASGETQVLLGRKKTGLGAGRVVGLGGHLEAGESAAEAAVRETAEESGLLVGLSDLRELATVVFRFPARPKWDQSVAVFASDRAAGEAFETDEIAPAWFPVERLPFEDMWDDARYWLPQVLAGEEVTADIVFADDCETVAEATVITHRSEPHPGRP